MNKKAIESWNKILDPSVLKMKVMSFSIYTTAFELLKSVVITKVEAFFVSPFDDNDAQNEYEKKVLSLSKSKLYASLLWLKDMGAIDDEDIKNFNLLKELRNDISHEMFDLLCSEPSFDIIVELDSIIRMLNKIELWWFLNLEMAIDPDAYPEDFDVQKVQPMSVWTLKLIITVALGDENEAKAIFDDFCDKVKNNY